MGNQWYGQTVIHLQCSETINHINGYKILCLIHPTTHYLWLLGATNGNHGQTVMHLQCSETINHI